MLKITPRVEIEERLASSIATFLLDGVGAVYGHQFNRFELRVVFERRRGFTQGEVFLGSKKIHSWRTR